MGDALAQHSTQRVQASAGVVRWTIAPSLAGCLDCSCSTVRPAAASQALAQMYVDEHPLALNLDIDRIRSLIGQWRADPQVGGNLARAIVLAAARTHLESGHDVVVPQFFGRPEFIEQIERLASQVGAEFNEIVLLDSKENMLRRFAERSRAAVDLGHTEAQEIDLVLAPPKPVPDRLQLEGAPGRHPVPMAGVP